MEDFLGRKTRDQIEMIKALVSLENNGKPTFSAYDISQLCGINTKKFAGAFVSLANLYNGTIEALILRCGREKIELTNNTRRYVQMWKINPEFKKKYWDSLVKALKNY